MYIYIYIYVCLCIIVMVDCLLYNNIEGASASGPLVGAYMCVSFA